MTTLPAPGPRGLRFRRHLRVRTVPGEATYLHSSEGVQTLRGEHVELLAPLLDGRHGIAEIVRSAAPRLSPADVARCLRRLSHAGLLVEAAPGDDTTPDTAFWDSAAVPDPSPRAPGVVELCTVGADAGRRRVHRRVRRALAGAGVRTVLGPDPDATLAAVLCDDLLDPALADVAARMRELGRPWVPVRTAGGHPSVGPFVEPDGSGPCDACLRHWVGGWRDRVVPAAPSVGVASGDDVLLGLLALACGSRLRGGAHRADRAVLRLDPTRLELTSHPVRSRPECPTCGVPDPHRPFPPRLAHRPRPVGSTRTDPPAAALALLDGLADDLTGVFADDGPGPDDGPLVSWRSRAAVPSVLRAPGPVRCAGVAPDREAAQVAALAEAVERHCSAARGDEVSTWAAFDDLPDAVHPDAIQLFSPDQLADRLTWNRAHEATAHVPVPFATDQPTAWTALWSLTAERVRHVPTGLLYLGAHGAGGALVADTSGLAAGTTPEDATVSGLLELVERDAVAIWWYNRLPVPEVGLDASSAPWVTSYVEGLAAAGRSCAALDLTTDLGIPVVAAVSAAHDGSRIAFGFGAGLDRGRALERALAEMHQLAAGLAAIGPEDSVARRWWTTARLDDQPHLVAADVAPPPTLIGPGPDSLADLDALRTRVEAAGLEVLLLDQSRPSARLSVMRVVVPGLRPMRPRFAPGRLADVPVLLGRRRTPVPAAELNPIPVFA